MAMPFKISNNEQGISNDEIFKDISTSKFIIPCSIFDVDLLSECSAFYLFTNSTFSEGGNLIFIPVQFFEALLRFLFIATD